VASRLDFTQPAAEYDELMHLSGLQFYSLLMPQLTLAPGSMDQILSIMRYAAQLHMKLVYVTADSHQAMTAALPRILDAADALSLKVALEPHVNAPFFDVPSIDRVLETIGNDPRLQIVLELGHLYLAGVNWRQALDHWGHRIGVVHLKNVGHDRRWASLFNGEISIPAVMDGLKTAGYQGPFIVEMNVLQADAALAEALAYLQDSWLPDH
jgi:sugar phosphate isomerase/epimerase